MGTRNYVAIANQAQILGLPVTFRTDLTNHDHTACERNPDTRRFVWAIGSTGTNMVWLDPCDVHFSTRSARSLVDCFLQNDRAALYFWDGHTLASIDADRAVEILTTTHDER